MEVLLMPQCHCNVCNLIFINFQLETKWLHCYSYVTEADFSDECGLFTVVSLVNGIIAFCPLAFLQGKAKSLHLNGHREWKF